MVIDIIGYRRFGSTTRATIRTMTQPLMYLAIKHHPGVREIYGKRLIDEGVIKTQELEGFISEFDAYLDKEF